MFWAQAMMEMRTMLVETLRRFSFALADGDTQAVGSKLEQTLEPVGEAADPRNKHALQSELRVRVTARR